MPPGGVGTRHGSAEPIRSGLSRKGLSALLKAAGALPDERCVVAGRARSDTEFLILGGIPLWFNQTHTFFAFTTRAIHVARKTTWTRVRPVQSFPNAHIDHVEVHTPWFGTSSLRFVFADSSSLQYDGVIRKFAKRVADHAGRIVPVRLV